MKFAQLERCEGCEAALSVLKEELNRAYREGAEDRYLRLMRMVSDLQEKLKTVPEVSGAMKRRIDQHGKEDEQASDILEREVEQAIQERHDQSKSKN